MRRDSDNYLFYKDIKQSSVAISDKHGLTYTQTRIYDYFSRGDYYLGDNDISMYFNPDDKGIGWTHDSNWARKLMEPLVKKGLLKKRKDQSGAGPGHGRKYEYWHKDFDIQYLVDGSCFVRASVWNDIKKRLGLPDGWFSTNKGNYNGRDFSTDIKNGVMKYKHNVMIMTHSDSFSWVHDVIGMIDSVDNKVRLPKYINEKIESLRRDYDKNENYPFLGIGRVYSDVSDCMYDEAYFSNYLLNGASIYKEKDKQSAKEAERLAATKRNKSDVSDKYIDDIFKEANRLIIEETTDTGNEISEKVVSILDMMRENDISFDKETNRYETDCYIFRGRKHKIEIFPDSWYQIISIDRERYLGQGDKKGYEVYESGGLPYKKESLLEFFNDKIKKQAKVKA